MAELLRGIKGRFLLSIGDRPEVRELFGGWAEIEELRVSYMAGHRQNGAKRTCDLLISGVDAYREMEFLHG